MKTSCPRVINLVKYRKIPKISPGGLYFSKTLIEGLIFGGAYIRRGLSTESFLRYEFRGLIFGGAYMRRGLFSEFYGSFARILVWFCGNF